MVSSWQRFKIKWQQLYDPSTSICRYELVTAGNIIKTSIEDFKVRMYEPNDLKEKLENIGFSEVNLRKTFERHTAPDANDGSIIYECSK